MKQYDEKKIWDWYQKIEDYYKSEMTLEEYCQLHKINKKSLHAMNYRINNVKKNNPEKYAENCEIFRKYKESGYTRKEFAEKNGVSTSFLNEMAVHFNYLKIIEKKKGKNKTNDIKFVQVEPKLIPISEREVTPSEVIEKQNDLEIMITKGVKVSISPNIDSMKIIKIIELLKDL